MSSDTLDFLDTLLADAEAIREKKKADKAKKKKDRADYLALTRPKTTKVNYNIKDEWLAVAYVRTVTVQTCKCCGLMSQHTHPQLLELNQHKTEDAQVFKPVHARLSDLPHQLLNIYEAIDECSFCFMKAENSPQMDIFVDDDIQLTEKELEDFVNEDNLDDLMENT